LSDDVVAHLRTFAPDAFCLCDAGQPSYGLPSLVFPEQELSAASTAHDPTRSIPAIDSSQTVAWLFTSGSTGKPQPHRKTWGLLVRNVSAEADILGLSDPRHLQPPT